MILIEYDLYEQCWLKSSEEHDHYESYDTKADALASVPRDAQQTVVVSDPRFAHHPTLADKYIGYDGAKTFYSVYREAGGQFGTTLNFEDWANQYLNRQLD